jgi:hypothetical protein
MLSFAELKKQAAAGSIDTVLVCIVDMQGRLMGKRFHASELHRERPRGNPLLQLPAGDRHRNGNAGRLCLDELGEGLWRLRHEAGSDNASAGAVA